MLAKYYGEYFIVKTTTYVRKILSEACLSKKIQYIRMIRANNTQSARHASPDNCVCVKKFPLRLGENFDLTKLACFRMGGPARFPYERQVNVTI